MATSRLFKKKRGNIFGFLSLVSFLFPFASFASSGITYHGKILKPNGDPVDSNNVQFRIQVRTPGAENCLLWEETQSRDLSTTSGVFALTIGDVSDATRVQTPVTNPNTAAQFSLDQVFSNRYNFAAGLTGCSVGNAYNPTASDGRILSVSFREAPTNPWEQMPITKVNFVPLALNSVQLEGYRAAEFLQLQPSVTQTPLSQGQVNTLLAILNGTAGASFDVAKTDSFVGDVTGPYNATVVARIRGVNVSAAAPANGQVLKLVGGVWTPSADDTGAAPGDATYAAKGVVQVDTSQAVSGLALASGVLSMPNVITAGGPTGNASTIPVITYDAKGRLTTVTTATVDDTSKLPLAGGTMTGNLNMGNQQITNAASVSATSVSTRSVVLNDNDTNTATIQAPINLPANYTLTLPTAAPTNGFVLSTDGTGQLSWIAPSAGSVTSITSTNSYLTVAGTAAVPTLTVNVGTAANTVAAGDDTRIVNAVQQAAYANDIALVNSCAANQKPYWNTINDRWECTAITGFVADTAGFVQNGNSFATAATLGTNDNQPLNFETNATTKMTILPNGNVGLGTTNPLFAFQIQNSDATAFLNGVGESRLYIQNTSNINNSPQVLLMKTGATGLPASTDTLGSIKFGASNSTFVWQETAGIDSVLEAIPTDSSMPTYMNFSTTPVGSTAKVERMRITGSGNVGIGTTTPTQPLDVVTNGTESQLAARAFSSTNSWDSGVFMGYRARGTSSSPTHPQNGDRIVAFAGGNGVAYNTFSGMEIFASENHTNSAQGTNIAFTVTQNGGVTRTTPLWITNSGNIGMGTSSPTTRLDVAGTLKVASGGEACSIAGDGGMIRYNGGNLQFCNGSAWQTLGVSGAGLTSLNGQTGSTQTFAVNASGTAPALNSATNVHTLSIPLASGVGVTSGTISKTEYDNFNAKLGTALNDGQIWIGNGSNVATARTLSGDVTVSNAGVTAIGAGVIVDTDISASAAIDRTKLASGTANHVLINNGTGVMSSEAQLAVSRGGTGASSFAANRIIASNGTGSALQAFSCGLNQAITFDASGNAQCGNVTGAGGFVNGGNSFGAAATLGTNDNFALNFETNNTTRMTILGNGNVGIGTTTPDDNLEIQGNDSSGLEVNVYNGANTWRSGYLTFRRARGTSAAPTAVAADDELGKLSFFGHDGSTIDTWAGEILSFADGTPTSGIIPSRFEFWTQGATAPTNPSMVIKGSGNVGIGTISPGTILDINGALSQRGMAAPAVSPAGQGRIYFDSTSNKFRVSENGGGYTDLVGGGGGSWNADSNRNLKAGSSALNALTTGTDNIALGHFSLSSLTDSTNNIALGFYAQSNMRAGSGVTSNIALGNQALQGSSTVGDNTGTFNVAIGFNTLAQTSSGTSNTAVGNQSMVNLSTGSNNTTLGRYAMQILQTGSGNTAVGQSAGFSGGGTFAVTSGNNNTFLGYDAGFGTAAQFNNATAIGYGARVSQNDSLVLGNSSVNVGLAGISQPTSRLDFSGALTIREIATPAVSAADTGRIYFDNVSNKFRVSENGGSYVDLVSAGGGGSIDALSDGRTDYVTDNNMFLGLNAGNSIASGGQYNTVLGQTAGDAITTGDNNTAFGFSALGSLTTGTDNTAFGTGTLASILTGTSFNTAVGSGAMASNSNGSSNTAIGSGAMQNGSSPTRGVAVGGVALRDNTGLDNTAVGYAAMVLNTTGANNTALGSNALYSNTGSNNVAVGKDTGTANTSGFQNTYIGTQAAYVATTAGRNVAVGYLALYANNADDNTAVGTSALDANTSGTRNVAVGNYALDANTTGSYNTAIGMYSLSGLTTAADNNIGLGYYAGFNITTGDNNIVIGNNAQVPSATGNSQLNIGDTIFGDLANDRVRIGGSGAVSAFADLDVAGSLAVKVSSGTAAQRPGTPANGMIRYNTDANKMEAYENGAWTNMIGGGGGGALSGITAATGTNTLTNGVNTQVWNWALTNSTADAFTFGETTASTGGSGDQSIVKTTTLASSTAVPLMVTNLGNALSFRINDQTGDTDTTPFVVDASGNVGIGTSNPLSRLHLVGDGTSLYMTPVTNTNATGIYAINSGNGSLFGVESSSGGAQLGGSTAYATVIGNQSGRPLQLGTNNAVRMTVDSVGNVGIGTTSPTAKLHVEHATSATTGFTGTQTDVYPSPSAASSSVYKAQQNYVGGGGANNITGGLYGVSNIVNWGSSATLSESIATLSKIENGTNGVMTLGIGTFTEVENVSTGTISNSIGSRIVVRNTSTGITSNAYGADIQVLRNAGTITNGYGVYIGNIQATNGWAIYSNDSTARSYFAGNVGIGTTSPTYKLEVAGQSMFVGSGTLDVSGAIAGATAVSMSGLASISLFPTRNIGLIAAGDDYGIYSAFGSNYFAGNVGIGTTGSQAALDVESTGTSSAIIVPRATTGNRPTTPVNGMIRYNTTTTLFEFYQNGAWVNYTTVSDGRLKTHVTPVVQGLEIVNQLNPVFYDWDRSNAKTTGFEEKHQVGFIAQEVEKVLPEVVNQGEDSYRSIEYGKMVAVAVAAIKELYRDLLGTKEEVQSLKKQSATQQRTIASKAEKSDVDQLRAENEKLKARLERTEKENAQMKDRLDQIEKMLQSR